MTARREVVALYETGAGAWPSNCGRSPSMHAHDGALFVQIVADGRAISRSSRVPALHLQGPAHDVDGEAGYGDGFDVALTCTNDRYVNDEGLCHALAAMLGPIGMRVRPMTQPASQHFGQVRRAELDFYLLGWGVTTFDSEYIFSLLYHTNTGALGGWNGTRFSDRAVDDQIHTLRQEVDQTRRNATVAALWRRLKEEVVYVPLHNQTITHAMSREFDIPVDVSNQPKMKFIAARKM